MNNVIIRYSLIKTCKRLTFDIHAQVLETIWQGADDGSYYKFVARNGYEVISRSRMDIQTERLWVLGAKSKDEPRSGTMVFSDNDKRDRAYDSFMQALSEWALVHGGVAVNEADRLVRMGAKERDTHIQAKLAEYGYPANSLNAGRAGWYAAQEILVSKE